MATVVSRPKRILNVGGDKLQPSLLPPVGSEEFWLLVIVIGALSALGAGRYYFRSAHGG